MGVQKITFDGASVSAKVDAELYHFLFSFDVGIFRHFKNQVSFTLAGNVITFQDGYVSVYGRLVYIENNTQVTIATDSSKSGYVVLGINTTNNSATIYTKESTASYPALTQTNLLNSNGLYEFALCAYTKTVTTVALNLSFQRSFIDYPRKQIDDFRTETLNRFIPKTITPTKTSNGVYTISGYNSQALERSIIHVILSGNTVVTFPGAQIFFLVGSSASANYRHNGSDHTLYLNYANSVLTLSCGSTTHIITKVVITTL